MGYSLIRLAVVKGVPNEYLFTVKQNFSTEEVVLSEGDYFQFKIKDPVTDDLVLTPSTIISGDNKIYVVITEEETELLTSKKLQASFSFLPISNYKFVLEGSTFNAGSIVVSGLLYVK